MKYTYPLLACTLIMMQASLYAEEAAEKPAAEPKKAFSPEQHEKFRMKMFDKNADGKLDEQELEAAKAHHEEMKKKFDKDGDGELNDDERKAMRETMGAQRPHGGPEGKRGEMLKKFDTNADGKLDETERKAMRDEMEARKASAPDKVMQEKPLKDAQKKEGKDVERKHDKTPDPAVLKAFDKDGDGKLSKEEHGAFRETRKAADKDGDGKLSDEERAAMIESLKK